MKKTTTNLPGGYKRQTVKYNNGKSKSVTYKPGLLFNRVKSVTTRTK